MAKKILVVDDNEDIVYMLKATLEKNGYEVMTAPDGQQALKLLKNYTPDLIIADLTMPTMSGWQFTAKVRQDERFTKTPIIVLSGLLEFERAPEIFEPADAYIPKPFDILEVVRRVGEFLKDPASPAS